MRFCNCIGWPTLHVPLQTKLHIKLSGRCILQVKFLKYVHSALVKQLNAYGIVLTLLVSITFVGFLQPPGSFNDKGEARFNHLTTFFFCFVSLSFLLAGTGLLTVLVGSATLLRPLVFSQIRSSFTNPSDSCTRFHAPDEGHAMPSDLKILWMVVLTNVYRVRRLEYYVGFSLGTCVAAFLCAGLALAPSNLTHTYPIVIAFGVGGVVFVLETLRTLMPVCLQQPHVNSLAGESLSQRLERYSGEMLSKLVSKSAPEEQLWSLCAFLAFNWFKRKTIFTCLQSVLILEVIKKSEWQHPEVASVIETTIDFASS